MLETLDLPALVAVFLCAALVVAVSGTRLARAADRLADMTGMGEALVGGVLLGMATSLSGTVVSVASALDGRASLAFSNGIGGIAAQTAFLAVADILYRRANLEHAAAELTHVLQAALLALMLSLPVLAFAGPEVSVLGVHPVSLLLPVIYVLGTRSGARTRSMPMWHPVTTPETRKDLPEEGHGGMRGIRPVALEFAALALVMSLAGWVIAQTGGEIADRTQLSEATIGALMTALATSLPELVTTLAAVRRGAVQLAVGAIIGGNTFDVLFLTLADIAYRDGSIYHAIGRADLFWLGVGIAMTSILLLGLIIRQKRGIGGIGFESAGLLAVYACAILLQTVVGA
ncbi:sodium:calcium antiporter [Limibaculum sp. M0105]|uniref:Sodium:calcium antiporter n=1 Tax=Thermohalobaculum xanthum TaxID=2753746 RepID=A0A8J7M613_9RHOB|nr:sodium:calcium antiporter [Thermohalobaculum xanthum]MBK0398748.1 sodium:calcium antiporter [Thermohalobaculum xanthum]